MLDIVLGFLAVLTGGVVLELFAAVRAPIGYQDEHGFHLGIPVGQAPDPSLLSTPAPRASRGRQPAYVPGQLEPVSST